MKNFAELGLKADLLKAITELGFSEATDIQKQALPVLLHQKVDFIGLAATGTGKTAAFGIPLLERLDSKKRVVQGLVLCPTRELVVQTTEQLNKLGKYLGLRSLSIYGGAGYAEQIHGLRRGDAIVVGTPGRVIDHLEKGNLRLNEIEVLVLDEADEMISMGFKEDLDRILSELSKGRSNTWLFSATLSRELRRVAHSYLVSPKQVEVNRSEMLSSTVEQVYYVTQEQNKPEVLCKLIDMADDFYGIIFCQTKIAVADLSQYLAERGYRVDSLHGDKDQRGREHTLQSFRDRRVNILVCTDVASRGLDIKDVSHVVNYSLPKELDSYVHRIGRTARSGKKGMAFSLVTRSQRDLLKRLSTATKSDMTEGVIPGRKEIGAKKVSALLQTFLDQPQYKRASSALDAEWRAALSNMSSEEIAGRFLCLKFPEIFVEKEASRTVVEDVVPGSRNSKGPSFAQSKRDKNRTNRGSRGARRGRFRSFDD